MKDARPRGTAGQVRFLFSTAETRTFGFFSKPGVFVALRADTADNTHAAPSLYEKYGDHVLRVLQRIAPSDKDEISDVESLIGNERP